MIHVIATITIADGQRDKFLEEFRKIIEPVRAEQGCIEYGPTVDAKTDISIQSLAGENSVTVIEKWEDAEALKAHFVVSHMVEYKERVADLVTDTKIEIFESAE